MNKKGYIIILYFVIISSLVIALVPVFFGLFPFTFDQARDLLWVKNQIDFKKPSLIGPWGSLTGVYFGPLWFWLLSVPYILSAGHPIATTFFNSLIVFSSVFVAAYLFRKNKTLSFFILLIGFLAPSFHGIAQFAFSQHLLPLFTIFLIYSFSQILLKSNQKHFLLSFFWVSLMFHADPPLSIFSLPSIFLISYLSPKKKKLLNIKLLFFASLIFAIPFLPQLAFDVRHDFIQLKSAFAYIKGENKSLGKILPFSQRLIDRPLKLFEAFRMTIFQRPIIVTLFALITIFYVNFKVNKEKFTRTLWKASLVYTISLWIIFTIFPPEFKNFYLDGLIIIFVLWLAIALTNLWQKKSLQKLIISFLIFAFFQNLSPLYFLKSAKAGFTDKRAAGSIFANQKHVIDFIYQDAQDKGFKVYAYVGPIYDYPYQYLFFWHGLGKYRYLPAEFAYLSNQPEYVQKKDKQLERLKSNIRPAEDIIYLIVEHEGYPERVEKWYQNFPEEKFKIINKKELPGNIVIEKRRKI